MRPMFGPSGRLDRAHAAVMGRMHVAHLEARALARETARSEGGDAPLVGDLRERIRLVHELRELRRTEKLADRRRHRFRVDEIVRHQVFGLGLREPLFHGALDAHEPGAKLVFRELTDRAHAAVAEVVDVVDLAAAVAQLHQDLDHRDDILRRERARAFELGAAHAAVELHASDRGQVVAVFREEEPVEERLHGFLGGRLARAASCGRSRPGRPADRPSRRCAASARYRRPGRGRWCKSSGCAGHRLRAASRAPSSVISSFALAITSPVAVSTTFSASARPIRKSSGAAMRVNPACSMSRTCFTVMRLSLATISLFFAMMSKRAVSPRMRSGTSSNSTRSFERWNVSNAKNSFRICSGVSPSAFSSVVTGILRRRSTRK